MIPKMSMSVRCEPAMNHTPTPSPAWQEAVFKVLKEGAVRQIAYVPDAGHSHAIRSAIADPDIEDVVLTTEEEGVALVCGAWLGGQRAVLLMQSSGVGNCVNMFSLLQAADFPFFTLVTMRGEYAEFNPWQGPAHRWRFGEPQTVHEIGGGALLPFKAGVRPLLSVAKWRRLAAPRQRRRDIPGRVIGC